MAESQHADSQPVRQRILLVEDDEEMRSLLADVLAEEEYEVVQAKNGAEALLCLHRDDFAVIVLDKNMPGLKPFRMEELLQTVRRALSRGDQFVPSPSAREIRS